jgi:membrane-bound metal-dependent hydrolase YbcI (DUF457 family)
VTVYSHFLWNLIAARGRSWGLPFAVGAVLPDVVYFPLMIRILLTEGPGEWGDLALWDAATAHPITRALHSYLPAGLAFVLAYLAGWMWLLPWLGGVLSHVLLDMLTHVSDAYPILWPLSDYRFPTPISYWDPAYHGREFNLIEQTALFGTLLVLSIRYLRRRLSAGRKVPLPGESGER